ncbi:MAG: hypothetical protein WC427_01240 [Candidatus Paceibacterota bacterium]|jgi:hypothetical protein
MDNFSLPIDKPGSKQNFSASQMTFQGEDGKRIRLGEKEDSKRSGYNLRKTPRGTKQAEKQDFKKYKQNINAIKERVELKKNPISKEEQENLRFYKIKFFKK